MLQKHGLLELLAEETNIVKVIRALRDAKAN